MIDQSSTDDVAQRSHFDDRVRLRVLPPDGELARPLTRGDCIDGPRPCPWVGCRFNNYLTGETADGEPLTLDCEPDEVEPAFSCALDVADLGGASLPEIGEALGVSRERIRQIQTSGLRRVQKRARLTPLIDHVPHGGDLDKSVIGGIGHVSDGRLDGPTREAEKDTREEDPEPEPPTRISFFAEGERADELVCAAVWNMFARKSNGDGFDCRSRGSKEASRWLAEQRAAGKLGAIKGYRPAKEKPMPRPKGELAAMFPDLHAKLSKHHGRPPTAEEVQEAAGPAAKTIANVRSCARRAGLKLHVPLRGAANAAKPAGRPALVRLPSDPGRPPRPAKAAAAPLPAKPSPGTDLVELVRERLARAEREVEACRAFLAALEVAS